MQVVSPSYIWNPSTSKPSYPSLPDSAVSRSGSSGEVIPNTSVPPLPLTCATLAPFAEPSAGTIVNAAAAAATASAPPPQEWRDLLRLPFTDIPPCGYDEVWL